MPIAYRQCLIAGMGVTFLPAVAVGAELAGRRLVAMPWAGGDYGLFTQMEWHRGKRRSPAFDAFVALARQMLAER